MTRLAVSARKIRKAYGEGDSKTQILHGVDLDVQQGECVFLAGPSGSGKSTLLSILGCILSPDSGQLKLLGKDTAKWSEQRKADFRRRNVGFIFQRFQLFRGLRAWENVKIKLDLIGVPAEEGKQRSLEILESLGLKDQAERHVTELSIGQLQRIAVGRALAGNPDLILADEPTASLDAESGSRAIRLLHQLADNGKAVLVVTHDERILKQATKIIRLEDGRVQSPANPNNSLPSNVVQNIPTTPPAYS